jgi:hypothetical protein
MSDATDDLWDLALTVLRKAQAAGPPRQTRRAKLASELEQIAAGLRSVARLSTPIPHKAPSPQALVRLLIDQRMVGTPLKINFARTLWEQAGRPEALRIELCEEGFRLWPAPRSQGLHIFVRRLSYVLCQPSEVPLAEGWYSASVVGGAILVDASAAVPVSFG